MKIDEGVNGKINAKVRQMLNSKAITNSRFQFDLWGIIKQSQVWGIVGDSVAEKKCFNGQEVALELSSSSVAHTVLLLSFPWCQLLLLPLPGYCLHSSEELFLPHTPQRSTRIHYIASCCAKFLQPVFSYN